MKPLIEFDKQPFLLLPATSYNAASFPFINASTFFFIPTKGPMHSDQYARRLKETFLLTLNVLWVELTLMEYVTVQLQFRGISWNHAGLAPVQLSDVIEK